MAGIEEFVSEVEVNPELVDLPELIDGTSEESDDEDYDDDNAAPELPVERR